MGAINTYTQWSTELRDAKRAEYGISVAEANEFYPDHFLFPQWWDYALTAFNAGDDFSTQAAHKLNDAQMRELSRTKRGLTAGVPVRYVA